MCKILAFQLDSLSDCWCLPQMLGQIPIILKSLAMPHILGKIQTEVINIVLIKFDEFENVHSDGYIYFGSEGE